jgi:hypothetical protein
MLKIFTSLCLRQFTNRKTLNINQTLKARPAKPFQEILSSARFGRVNLYQDKPAAQPNFI